jgi:putative DNA primase/helicase
MKGAPMAGIDDVKKIMGAAEDVNLPEDMRPPTDPSQDDHAGGGDDDGAPPMDADLIRKAALCPLNDIGNGQRFTLYFGDDVLWVPRVGWFVWNGRLWAPDADKIEVRRRAQKVSDRLAQEIPYIVLSDRQMIILAEENALLRERRGLEARKGEDGEVDPEAQARIDEIDTKLKQIGPLKAKLDAARKAHRNHARVTGNSGRIDAMVTESGIDLSRRLEELDAGALDVNTETGVLRFSVDSDSDAGMSRVARVELVAHDRAQLLTKSVAAGYDPAATCPAFTAFIERVQPSAEMRRFLQRWFGLSMTALTGEQKLVFLHGIGANGKSVLVDLMARLFGDYSATAKIESLIGKNRRSGGDATPDIIPLVNARFVRASEPEEGERLQEAKIKELTGGEPMLVRGLNADFFEFLPVFKLTISGNHKPDIRGSDDGIWRRLLLVPFDVQIPKGERDPDLVRKLFEERAGILNWVIEGLLDYLENGLQEPEAVLMATQEYRDESDPYGTMLAECAVVDGSDTFLSARTLVDAFRFWQFERGESPFGERTVSNKMRDKAGKWKHPTSGFMFAAGKSGVTGYRGIRLTDTFQRRFDERPATTGRQQGGGKEWDM